MRRAVIGLLVLATACSSGGSSTPKGPQFADVAAIASALQKAGLGCDDFKDTTDANTSNVGTEYSSGRGKCTVDNEETKFEVYKDAGAQRNQIGQAQSLGCSFGKAFGITSFAFVDGPLWTIDPKTETAARAIAAKIGGEVKVITC